MSRLVKLHLSEKDNRPIAVPVSDIVSVNTASDKENKLLGANAKVYYSRSAWIGGEQILVRETLDEVISLVNILKVNHD